MEALIELFKIFVEIINLIVSSPNILIALMLTGFVLSLFGSYINYRGIKSKREKNALDNKIKSLTAALTDSSELIESIKNEIESRYKLVEKLKDDHKHYENLLKLKKSEVEAVAQLLRGELQKENKKSFYKGVAVNFLFFLLGSTVSLILAYYAK